MEIISKDSKFDSKTKFTARSLLKNWSKFEVILTAVIYLDLFSISTPVSQFLQSPSLNYLTAFNMVDTLVKEIKFRRENAYKTFNQLYSKVKHFIKEINKELDLNNCELLIKDDFKKDKLVGKKKVIPDDQAKDERPSIPVNDLFKIETYNYIHDIFTNSLDKRFLSNSKLLKDCIFLDPKHFNNIKHNIPADALVELSRLTNIDRNTLVEELQQFAIHFDGITKSLKETFTVLNDNLESPIDEYEPNFDQEDL